MSVLIVHLSDIHLNKTANPILEKRDRLVDAIASVGVEVSCCVIVLAGDIAYSGSQDEYVIAAEFVDELQLALTKRLGGCDVHIVMVPGNHDCSLKPENGARSIIINRLNRDTQNLLDPSIVDICTSAQENFFEFREVFDSTDSNRDDKMVYKYSFKADGATLDFLCLNTAWVSQLPERQGSLVFPSESVPVEVTDADITVSVMHHPYNWLDNENARQLRNRLESVSDIILAGHEHVPDRYRKVQSRGSTNEYLEGGVLQDSRHPSESSFNVIALDLPRRAQKITTFHWDTVLYRKAESSDADWMPLQVNQLERHRKFRLNGEFELYLDDPNATFTTSKRDLRLADVFIYPTLQEQSALGDRENSTFRAYDLFDYLQGNFHVVIDGPDNSGKTTLAKALFRDLLQSGLTPVLLSGADISDATPKKVSNDVYRAFKRQYSADLLEEYQQLPKAKKVLFLDDLHRTRLNPRGRSRLLHELKKHCEYLIVFSNDFSFRIDAITSEGASDVLSSFSNLRIVEFGYQLRDEMVQRWLRPEEDLASDPKKIAQRLMAVRNVLDTVLGRNFIPSYPFFVLSVLQLIESNIELDTSASSYGYGYFYETLIQKQIEVVSSSDDLDPSTAIAYLSTFAHYLFRNRIRDASHDEMAKIHTQYCSEYSRSLDAGRTLKAFSDASILVDDDYNVSFKYSYYYYYFVAVHLRDNISDKGVREDIAYLSKKVYREEYANILLFLTHLSKEPYIVEQMLDQARRLYDDVEPTDLDGDVEFLSSMYDAVPTLIYEDKDPEEVREKLAIELDKVNGEGDESGENQDLDDDEEVELAAILDINRAYKTIQILGQMLKNSPGSIKGERKLEVARECYSLARRLLAKIFGIMEKNIDSLVHDLVVRIESNRPDISHDDLVKAVKRLLFSLTRAFGFGMIKWITHSIGSDKLVDTYSALRSEDNSVATALIDTSVSLDHVRSYPTREIAKLSNQLEGNVYSQSLLRWLVMYHLDLYYVDSPMKQKLCVAVGLEYRPRPSGRALERSRRSRETITIEE